MDAQQANTTGGIPESASATGARSRGAQPSNRNAMTHGRRLAIGNLPKGYGWIKTLCAKFRRSIEQAIEAQGRTLSPYEAALVQSATRHEQAILLTQKHLRKCEPGDAMILDHSREIARLSDSRDRLLALLNLDRSQPPVSKPAWMTARKAT